MHHFAYRRSEIIHRIDFVDGHHRQVDAMCNVTSLTSNCRTSDIEMPELVTLNPIAEPQTLNCRTSVTSERYTAAYLGWQVVTSVKCMLSLSVLFQLMMSIRLFGVHQSTTFSFPFGCNIKRSV
uniref:Uncharacterized protein n=1 Tax=Arundo donax TaxID=35708 RepID=A0A0A9AJH3_ARUDO